MSKRILLVLTAVSLVGCFPPSRSNPEPVAVSDAQVAAAAVSHPGTDRALLDHGRSLVVTSCNRCHGYPTPNQVDADEWSSVAARMCEKAKLTGADADAVTRYLLATAR